MTGMELRFQLVPDDYAALTKQTLGVDKSGGTQVQVMRYALPVYFAIFLVPSLLRHRGGSVGDWIWLAIGIAWLAFFPRVLTWRVAGRIRKLAPSGLGKGAIGYQELDIDERGITQRSSFGSVERFWPGVERFVETPEYFFIYYGTHSAFIVPKSWIGTSADALRQTLGLNIPPATPAT